MILALLCFLAIAPRPAQATFPGRPGLIVFNMITFSGDGGDFTGGLYAIRPGQQRLRQLTSNRSDYNPSFAPSGDRLVFRRTDGDRPGIYTLNLRNGNSRRLPSRESDVDPALGPNGMIAFSRFVNGSGYDLFLRLGNGRLRRLTSDSGSDQEAVFTPDGEQIVFSRDYRKASTLAFRASSEKEGLYAIRTNGTGLRMVRRGSRGRNFDISPDGRRFIFGSTTERYPAYSPDGSKVAYANDHGLWIRRADGAGNPTLVFETDYRPYEAGATFLVQPAWQPLP